MKSLSCLDAGLPCDFVAQAETEDEVLEIASRHAARVHRVDVTPEYVEDARVLIRDVDEEEM